ncbi:MAG: hypothetical protein ACE37H_13620 [Phycisphaeraceae bacterium]
MQRWPNRLLAKLFALSLVLALAGCAAQKHLDAGDAAAAAGDMHGAVYHYQRAIGLDDSLTRDTKFRAKLAVAEARVAYDRAVELREQGDYEEAIEQLRLAIQRDARYEAPKRLLPQVRVEASRVRYVRAVEAADAGDLGRARVHLERSLQQDMTNERSAFALASLAPERLPAETPGLAKYKRGLDLSAERLWPAAEKSLALAVGEGPGLLPARAELHRARTQLERSRRYAGEGANHLAECRIGPAIDRLELSLDVWPGNASAQRSLALARDRLAAADAKLAEAADAAANRQWEQAIALAERGLAIDASHAGLQQSLNKYSGMAASDYDDQGDELFAKKRLVEAERAYARAVELDPSLTSARTSLRATRDKLARARALMTAGQGHIDALQMAGAITVLNQSLDIWPFNDRSHALLGHAKEQQRQAGDRYHAALEAAKVGAWDPAIELADEALALDRSYQGLTELRSDLPYRAAADYTQRGSAHLNAGELDDAQSEYEKALGYVDRFESARVGMASVYEARGRAFEAQGRLGAAMLHYLVGRDYQPEHRVGVAVKRLNAAVRDRVGMGLEVSIDPGRGGAVGPNELGNAISGALANYRSAGLGVNAKASPYAMNVIVGEATIDQRRVSSIAQTHGYTVTELRHNDAYDHVLACLKHEERVLHDKKCAYDDILRDREIALRKAERLRPPAAPTKPGRPPVKQPGQDDASYQEALRRHEERVRCYERDLSIWKTKQQTFLRALGYYKSLGKTKDRVYSAYTRQKHTVRDLHHKLSRTPRQIKVVVPQRWPYTVETHALIGRLTVTTQLIESATGRVVRQAQHRASFRDEDELVLNARPDIGLHEDRLSLASDDQARRSMVQDVSRDASPWAVNAAVQHRLGLIGKRAEQLRRAGDEAGALEAEVDAAVLLSIVDRAGSVKQLDGLADRHVD